MRRATRDSIGRSGSEDSPRVAAGGDSIIRTIDIPEVLVAGMARDRHTLAAEYILRRRRGAIERDRPGPCIVRVDVGKMMVRSRTENGGSA